MSDALGFAICATVAVVVVAGLLFARWMLEREGRELGPDLGVTDEEVKLLEEGRKSAMSLIASGYEHSGKSQLESIERQLRRPRRGAGASSSKYYR